MWNLPLTHIYLVALGGHWALTAGLFSSVHVKQLETGTAPALGWRIVEVSSSFNDSVILLFCIYTFENY